MFGFSRCSGNAFQAARINTTARGYIRAARGVHPPPPMWIAFLGIIRASPSNPVLARSIIKANREGESCSDCVLHTRRGVTVETDLNVDRQILGIEQTGMVGQTRATPTDRKVRKTPQGEEEISETRSSCHWCAAGADLPMLLGVLANV